MCVTDAQGYLPPMFQVLHSSAGAGKTHALVKHYLAHALRGEEPGTYRQVLALTFTTAAAGEMKERVMQYLQELSAGRVQDARMADVLEHLRHTAQCSEAEVVERSARVLRHMLHHWGDVAISTIDAFTRRVVQPFARDLQLDQELRMTTEQDHYQQLAVEALVAEAGTEPTLTGLLTEVCLQLLHDERSWDPEKPLLELGDELQKESSITPLKLLSTLDPGMVGTLVRQLRQEEHAFRERVRAIGRQGMKVLHEAGLRDEDLFQGSRGVAGYFRKLATFSEALERPNSYVRKALEEGKWAGGKTKGATLGTVMQVAPQLEDLIRQGEALAGAPYKAFVLRRAVARDLPTAFALHALSDRLEAIKRTEGVAFFSDLTRKVAEVVKDEPAAFIHERMGERYRHFLIDEFQDTSLLQWNALLPLIDNALGAGGSALLVGDAKQAIYRWRNGEVRLFTHFPKLFGRDPADALQAERERTLERTHRPVEPLRGNHRSASTVVDFNNRIFGELAPLLPQGLQEVYRDHAQQVVRVKPGLVQLRALPEDLAGEARMQALLEQMMATVAEALADGFAPGDIAILVRSKALGQRVSGALVAQGLQVVSPDGLQLSGDPFILLLIELLRFLCIPAAGTAARVLQYKAMLTAPADATTVDPFAESGPTNPVERVRLWLWADDPPILRTTLSDLLVQLAHRMGARPASDVQLLTLLDEVHHWTLQHGQDITGFLAHWDRTGGSRSVAPPEHGHAVQVMTVHKSKGLQFPVVILPDGTMATRNNHGARFWAQVQDTVPELPVALLKESAALDAVGLPELTEEQELRQLDTLNLTYVAFTRPEQRLYVQLSPHNKDVVTQHLLGMVAAEGTDGVLELGDRLPPWRPFGSTQHPALQEVATGDALSAARLRLEAPQDWDPSAPEPQRSYGNAVHYILERITTPDDLEDALAQAEAAGMLTKEGLAAVARHLRPQLHSADLQPWFGAQVQVRTEATLIGADGKAQRPDRVVFEGEQVRVLDIKTGKPQDSHHTQVRNYMALLKEVGCTHVEGALWYVNNGQLQPVEA